MFLFIAVLRNPIKIGQISWKLIPNPSLVTSTSPKIFRSAQINLRNSPLAQWELELWLHQNHVQACAVSDPSHFLSHSSVYRTSHYLWIPAPTQPSLSGIFVDQRIPLTILSLPSHRATALRLSLPTEALILVSIYLQPNTLFGLEDLQALLTSLTYLHLPILILGDFNGHSPLWFDTNRNEAGSRIEDFIETNDLFILNRPALFPPFMMPFPVPIISTSPLAPPLSLQDLPSGTPFH